MYVTVGAGSDVTRRRKGPYVCSIVEIHDKDRPVWIGGGVTRPGTADTW